jgi:hypothetical protein
MMKTRKLNRLIAIGLLCLVAAACGSRGDIYGGQENLPVAGVSPWGKIDFYGEYELVQPFILEPEPDHELIEPFVMGHEDRWLLFYEDATMHDEGADLVHTRSIIRLAQSGNGFDWEIIDDAVLAPSQDWEEGIVGAPTVIYYDGSFILYYRGGTGNGIGRAVSQDGWTWVKSPDNPILIPDQDWEGGPGGIVTSPSIALEDGTYMLWYGGGLAGYGPLDKLMGKAVGYAESEDGVHFIKRDIYGRDSEADPGSVAPILTAEKDWEGVQEELPDTGAVGMPGVYVDRSGDRSVFRMYYTGHRIGDLYSDNASIGYAGSFDGIEFVRADDLLNPVVTEKFALTLPGISELLDYDEYAGAAFQPSNGQYLMVFTQADALDQLSYGLKGISMAACPPLE